MVTRKSLLVCVALLAAGCHFAVGRLEPATTLDVAGRDNAHVSLAADGDRVAAAWAASGSDGTDVYAAFSDNGGARFGTPVRVNDVAGDASAGGEQPPRIVIRDRRVDVVWVSKHGGPAAIRAASSNDGGATFAPATTITPPGLSGARGWESAALADDGAMHAVWLDGRPPSRPAAASATDALREASTSPHQHGAMIQNIFHAAWKQNQGPVETQVAANVCFCCKTAIVTRGSDVYVAWRHLFPGGARDIAVARSADGGATFSAPVRVSDDEWKLDACPDDGPSMAIDRAGTLRIAWPTLVHDRTGDRIAIFEATSADNGRTFTPRTRVDSTTASASHPRIAAGPRGRAVVWDEIAGGARRAWMRAGDTAAAEPAGGGETASYPAVAATSYGFVVGWTEQDGERSIVRARKVAAR